MHIAHTMADIYDVYDVVSPISCNESKTGRKKKIQTQFAKIILWECFPLLNFIVEIKLIPTKLNLSNPLTTVSNTIKYMNMLTDC
jgi:hypothetical protein